MTTMVMMSSSKLEEPIQISESAKAEEESLLTEIDSHGTLEHMDSRPPAVLATTKQTIIQS